MLSSPSTGADRRNSQAFNSPSRGSRPTKVARLSHIAACIDGVYCLRSGVPARNISYARRSAGERFGAGAAVRLCNEILGSIRPATPSASPAGSEPFGCSRFVNTTTARSSAGNFTYATPLWPVCSTARSPSTSSSPNPSPYPLKAYTSRAGDPPNGAHVFRLYTLAALNGPCPSSIKSQRAKSPTVMPRSL